MPNFMITYSDKELELKNKINELKKLKFNTISFEKRLEDINSRFIKSNNSFGSSTQAVQEAQFNAITLLADLENDIQKAFSYFYMNQSTIEISKKINTKNEQTKEKLDMYSKGLLSIATTLNNIHHTNYEYYKNTQSIIYSTIYELIKIEYRHFDHSNTLDNFIKLGLNENYLIDLMNTDVNKINSQNIQEFIINENTVTSEGKINPLSLKELSMFDKEHINNLMAELIDLNNKIEKLMAEVKIKDEEKPILVNEIKDDLDEKRHHVKGLIKCGWSPIVSLALLATLITIPWTIKDEYNTTTNMETKTVYDVINGTQTIKEYGNDDLGETVIIDYGNTSNYNGSRTVKVTNIPDNKETDPSKLLDMDVSKYKSSTTTYLNKEANKTSIDEFRSISIVSDIDLDDSKTEFNQFEYVFLSLLANCGALILWMFAEMLLSEIELGLVTNFSETLKYIRCIIVDIENEIINNNNYRKYNHEYEVLVSKLTELKKRYNEVYDKCVSLQKTLDSQKLVRK